MQNSKMNNVSAALLAFDSEGLKTLLDEITITCDLTFGYHDGLRKVTLTDKRDKLTIIGYRPTLAEALSYVIDVWQNVETVEIAARLFADWQGDGETDQRESLTVLEQTEAV